MCIQKYYLSLFICSLSLSLSLSSIDERVVFIVGLFLMAFGFFALIPMGNDRPNVGISSKGITCSC